MNSPRRTQIAIAIVEQDDRVLIGRRPQGVPLAGYWEFPGGKIMAGETPREAVVRECLEETGLRVCVVDRLAVEAADYDYDQLELQFFRCRPVDASIEPKRPFCWVGRDKLVQYQFPPANIPVIQRLLRARPSART